ncbi:TolC family protein [Haliea sp.]
MSSKLMNPLAFAACLLVAGTGAAQQASDMSLGEVLSATLAFQDAGHSESVDVAAGMSLLGDLPVLSALHVQSDLDQGADETELSLNLPLKSGLRHRLDESLSGLEVRLSEASTVYRAWYFSGLIREAVWAHRLAQVQISQARERVKLLAELESRSKLQVKAGTVSEYAVLLAGQERLDAELLLSDHQAALREAALRFGSLTGLPAVPSDISEPVPVPQQPRYDIHPRLVLLESKREQERLLAGLADPRAANWNLALVARDFSGPGQDERQFGLAVDVPLGLVEVRHRGVESQKAAAQRDFILQRDQARLEIRRDWQALRSDAERLQTRQRLLQESALLGEKIEAQLLSLRASNEVEAELVLRRLLDVLDRRGELALIKSQIHRNAALQRQAAGYPL